MQHNNNNNGQFDSTFDRRDGSRERSGFYPSPYANDNSVSPIRENGVEETIQGNIDGAMTV